MDLSKIIRAIKLKRVLVLGMVFATPEGARKALDTSKSGTTSSVYRDYVRLKALEDMGFEVVALSDGGEGTEWQHDKFMQARVGTHTARELVKKFGPRPFDHVFCDYVRFPAAYLRQLLGDFIKYSLPGLLKEGLLHSRSQIVLPHLRKALQDHIYDSLIRTSFIMAKDYALYEATETVDPACLGGSTNHEHVYGRPKEMRGLDPKAPFVVIRIKPC